MNIKFKSKADAMTVAKIVGTKANEMYKRGSKWARKGAKDLSCVDMGKLANSILKQVSKDEFFVFKWEAKK